MFCRVVALLCCVVVVTVSSTTYTRFSFTQPAYTSNGVPYTGFPDYRDYWSNDPACVGKVCGDDCTGGCGQLDCDDNVIGSKCLAVNAANNAYSQKELKCVCYDAELNGEFDEKRLNDTACTPYSPCAYCTSCANSCNDQADCGAEQVCIQLLCYEDGEYHGLSRCQGPKPAPDNDIRDYKMYNGYFIRCFDNDKRKAQRRRRLLARSYYYFF